jgi:hypothetical protein
MGDRSLARLKRLKNSDPSAVAIELSNPNPLLEKLQQIVWPLWLLPTRNMVGASERQHLGLVGGNQGMGSNLSGSDTTSTLMYA